MKYAITPEHEAQLDPWAEKWIANALSVEPMNQDTVRDLVIALYSAVKMPAPRVVFTRSPFAARFAGGFAAGLHYARKTPGLEGCVLGHDALRAALNGARLTACAVETLDATLEAMGRDPVRLAPTVADDAPGNATHTGIGNVRQVADALFPGHGNELMECAADAYRLWDGGNQWSGWPAYLTFFRYVAKLPLDYAKWDAYERLAQCSGPRIVHEAFCILSDLPEYIRLDSKRRPHCTNGPFMRWRDGAALWAMEGIRLPAKAIARPETLTGTDYRVSSDHEARELMLRLMGLERYWHDASPALVVDGTALYRDGYVTSLRFSTGDWVRVPSECSTLETALSAMMRGEQA